MERTARSVFDILGREKAVFRTGVYPGIDTTSVGNGYGETIEACVRVNIDDVMSKRMEAMGKIGVSAEGSALFGVEKFKGSLNAESRGSSDTTFKHFHQLPGYVKIKPGSFLVFPMSGHDGKVFVSIKCGENVIADNLPVINDYNVVVDEDGCVQNCLRSSQWVDIHRIDHSKPKK